MLGVDPALGLLAPQDVDAHVAEFAERAATNIASSPELALAAYAQCCGSTGRALSPERWVLRDSLHDPRTCLRDATLNDVALAHVARMLGVVVVVAAQEGEGQGEGQGEGESGGMEESRCGAEEAVHGDPAAAHAVVLVRRRRAGAPFELERVGPLAQEQGRRAAQTLVRHHACTDGQLCAALDLARLRAALAACLLPVPSGPGRITKARLAQAIANAAAASVAVAALQNLGPASSDTDTATPHIG